MDIQNLSGVLGNSLSSGADFAELFAEQNGKTSVVCDDNRLEKILTSYEEGSGLRVLKGTETRYASTSSVKGAALKGLPERVAFSKATKKTADVILKKLEPAKWLPVKIRPESVPLEKKIDVVMRANEAARAVSPLVKQVTVNYADSTQKVWIANSEGRYVEDERVRTRFVVQVIAGRDGNLQTGYEAPGIFGGFEIFDLFDAEKLAIQAAERAIRMLDAKPAPSGPMTVILASEAGGTFIHEACGHGLEADHIAKGSSVYKGKIGEKVGSELMTVHDDATLPHRYGSFHFDDEGTPAQDTIAIENGILKTYLTDRIHGGQIKSPLSGNGRRETFRSKPIPRMTNTYVANGTEDPHAIIDSVKDGLLVTRMGGGEVNTTNGDFVFEVSEGFLLHNGKVGAPVRGAILLGNGIKTLSSIDRVGNDLQFTCGTCGKFDHAPVGDGLPTLRIPEVVVGGQG